MLFRSPHAVTIEVPARSYGRGQRIERIARTVQVEPGGSAKVPLLQPAVSIEGHGFLVVIDGRRHRQADEISHFSHGQGGWYSGGNVKHLVLASHAIDNHALDSSLHITDNKAPSRSNEIMHVLRALQASVDWSDNWLGYSRFDGVFITTDDLQVMPAQVKRALWRYVRAGGMLAIVGDWRPGPGEIEGPPRAFPAAYEYPCGFGRVVAITTRDPESWSDEFRAGLVDRLKTMANPIGRFEDTKSANRAFPVVKDIQYSARGLFILVVVFAVVIGPINLLWLHRMRRRLWLLWTVPAISLTACGTLLAYAFLAEGWTPTIRLRGITVLDQRTHEATTIAMAGYYAPLTPSGGLSFPYSAEISPMIQYDG